MLIGTAEEGGAVDVIDVGISVCAGVMIRIENDPTAIDILFVGGQRQKVGLGDHQVGDIGVLFANDLIQSQVSILQMLRVGGIVVVVGNENAHIEGRQIACYAFLCFAVARKAEVDVVDIQSLRDDVLIRISGARNTTALRDRATVVNDGGNVEVFYALSKRGIGGKTDPKVAHVAVAREVNGEVAQALRGEG